MDTLIRTIRRNLLTLLGGTSAAGAITLMTVALNARALGAEGLGVITFIQAYTGIVIGITNAGTQQPVTKIGIQAILENDKEKLENIVRIGILMDLICAFLAGIISVSIIYIFISTDKNIGEFSEYFYLYAATAFFSGTNSMLGVFRIFDRFKYISILQISESFLIFVASAVLFLMESPIEHYIVIFAIIQIISKLLYFLVGLQTLSKNKIRWAHRKFRIRSNAALSEFLEYIWTTWGTSTANTIKMRADILLIGFFHGTAAVGVYGVIRQIMSVVNKPVQAAGSAAFPEIARLAASRDVDLARNLLGRVALLGLAPGIALVAVALAFGKPLLEVGLGPEFAVGHIPLVLLLLGGAVMLSAATFGGFVQAFISPRHLLGIYAAAAAVLGLTLFLAVPDFALVGGAIAQVAFAATVWLLSWWLLQKHLR